MSDTIAQVGLWRELWNMPGRSPEMTSMKVDPMWYVDANGPHDPEVHFNSSADMLLNWNGQTSCRGQKS
ncbi:hypothetical protein [Pontibacter sp. G13]|uniref:hypothetical protein n=1 Tax=Pontibacter sp. G13 TaxID=3074898 RepID=UPI00288B809D|nr:hypothetical protein [Pontibacter sp. G13]WNJ21557.1 hypothetical protein RJD25_28685 [Pontibacter sp. G13]